ncbi:unnamed protein product [Clonostachys byssicola]|uniref:Uncharacterized protein n=1 Tax=Clonostachys byssicola TaxID=160290 RepID=A0A9N9XVZ2_9HYPO|nr:unnamed protein product [Clonostachys byssicola]
MEVFGIDFEILAEPVSWKTKRRLVEFTKYNKKIEALEKEMASITDMDAVLEYDFSSKQLRWYEDKTNNSCFWLWYLNYELVSKPSSSPVIEFSEKDLIHVALWAANKAQLWLTALDSGPLLAFVEGLDKNTYVL